MVSLLRKRRPMELASGSSPSFPLADLVVPRRLLPQRSSWLRRRAVTCSATTWLSTAVLRLSKGTSKLLGQTKTELLPANSAAETAPNRYIAIVEKLDGKSSDWTESHSRTGTKSDRDLQNSEESTVLGQIGLSDCACSLRAR